ncbi:MAG TPA: methyltransferase domain-containing protein [Micromonosporaceae bacterium]|nr:methyltransferase domain-containing protein [Micromonosporaceae bacterium]
MDAEILAYYELGGEVDRLSAGQGVIERVRTQDILRRVLPVAPARVVDVGGATGEYAAWLAALGYDVRLIDPVPLHVAAARARGVDTALGDARRLTEPDDSADAVLLLGPLYHLTSRPDRIAALAEAERVARPGGLVVGAAISRFASAHVAITQPRADDPEFLQTVASDLATGVHRNPSRRPGLFTTAYFHRPEDLADEFRAAGLADVRVRGVEGVAGWCDPAVTPALADPAQRAVLLDLLARLEEEPSVLGASAHLLATGVTPPG